MNRRIFIFLAVYRTLFPGNNENSKVLSYSYHLINTVEYRIM